jgi:hypothetical protein
MFAAGGRRVCAIVAAPPIDLVVLSLDTQRHSVATISRLTGLSRIEARRSLDRVRRRFGVALDVRRRASG